MKTTNIHIRCESGYKDSILAIAKGKDMTISEYIRYCIDYVNTYSNVITYRDVNTSNVNTNSVNTNIDVNTICPNNIELHKLLTCTCNKENP